MIVHLVLNSHLDPVWRWRREHGIGEVLATAYSACGILEDYPETVITRGESWFYETVEEIDPALFERIRGYVKAGRWRIVGGWYVQPDCNLASPETYRKHGEIGGAYFREKFGIAVKTGYNVDSFGHGAMLPSFYRNCGVENYVMMRPNKTEMTTLPANDFLWRAADGSLVTTSRIIDSYSTWPATLHSHIEAVLAEANPKIGHVMCMYGFGNHGCGPTRAELDWLLEHRRDWPGVEIRFSHPDAYFEAVKTSGVELPVFTGELQHHAVGCYSIVARIKREVRSAENALIQRGRFLPEKARRALWKKVLFATFHDVLPGSSIAGAYGDIYDDLGKVRAEVNDAVVAAIARKNAALPDDRCQRLIFDNPGGRKFSGIAEGEPWFSLTFCDELRNGGKGLAILDESGNELPFQILPHEAAALSYQTCRIAIPLEIPPRGRRILRAVKREAKKFTGPVSDSRRVLANAEVAVTLRKTGLASFERDGVAFLASAPELQVIDDPSDTWSHFIDRYPLTVKRRFRCKKSWMPLYSGPLTAAWFSEWVDAEKNTASALCRVEAGTPGVHLDLRINWHGNRELLKLTLRPAFPVRRRFDGCPGGTVDRPLNGEEYPVFNRITLEGEGHRLTLVSPDIFSADVQSDGTVRLTLLRSTAYAFSADSNHFDLPGHHRFELTDQGVTDFHLLLLPDADEATVERELYRFTRPLKYSETTRGILR